MRRFAWASLTSLILVTVIAPTSQANLVFYNSNAIDRASVRQITPNALVTMAHRGRFKAQGIPGAIQLASEYVLGRISAKEIVQAAIDVQLLFAQVANNPRYLNAVVAQLEIHLRIH